MAFGRFDSHSRTASTSATTTIPAAQHNASDNARELILNTGQHPLFPARCRCVGPSAIPRPRCLRCGSAHTTASSSCWARSPLPHGSGDQRRRDHPGRDGVVIDHKRARRQDRTPVQRVVNPRTVSSRPQRPAVLPATAADLTANSVTVRPDPSGENPSLFRKCSANAGQMPVNPQKYAALTAIPAIWPGVSVNSRVSNSGVCPRAEVRSSA